MDWLDLLAWYDEAMSLEKARARRPQPVVLMVQKKKGGRRG